MLVPPYRVLHSIRTELIENFGTELGEASLGQSLISAAQLLEARERGGVPLVLARLQTLDHFLVELSALPALTASYHGNLAELREAVHGAQQLTWLEPLEAAWKGLITATEQLFSQIATAPAAPDMPAGGRAKLALMFGEWEIADRRLMTTIQDAGQTGRDTRITQERLEHYLRDRFAEPALKIVKFRPLPGGFGKQTILFDVEGEAISGSLVMRRDPGEPTIDNDCHRIRNEYPVIRAAFERGFPAPDAIWLDTEHEKLPGGDFIVMRCAPGQTGGNVFRATTELSDRLTEVLAEGMARLHTLPPCTELGDLTESIRAEWWNLPLRECVSRYIHNWYDLYLANAHNPSPTLVSLYGWLFDNIPDAPGKPVLLHGDIGFHNMLVDNGRLSAVVDWEFAHVGDPGEDVGYVKNTSGGVVWEDLMAHYRAAGGPEIDPTRLQFFQVWGQVRNATASNLTMGKFDTGAIPDLKLAYTGHYHYPHFIEAACDLIAAGPGGKTKTVGY